MNVQSIWAGEYYAFSDYRPNNTFVMNARKGKAIRVEKRQEFGRERKSAYALLEVERNGDGTTYEKWVRARDVIDFWDDYERERNAYRAEQEERQRQREEEYERVRQEREERMRHEREIAEAKARAEQADKDSLVERLTNRTQLPREAIYSVGPGNIQLDRRVVEAWLSTPDNRGGMNV